jgi:hypothetical protein
MRGLNLVLITNSLLCDATHWRRQQQSSAMRMGSGYLVRTLNLFRPPGLAAVPIGKLSENSAHRTSMKVSELNIMPSRYRVGSSTPVEMAVRKPAQLFRYFCTYSAI